MRVRALSLQGQFRRLEANPRDPELASEKAYLIKLELDSLSPEAWIPGGGSRSAAELDPDRKSVV